MTDEFKFIISPAALNVIAKIIKRGNSAEIKREGNNLVVVEIQRKVQDKTSITG